jgi:hypothetical protein
LDYLGEGAKLYLYLSKNGQRGHFPPLPPTITPLLCKVEMGKKFETSMFPCIDVSTFETSMLLIDIFDKNIDV